MGRPAGRPALITAAAATLAGAAVLAPVLFEGQLEVFYDRTLGFQNDRGSPFSVWGLYELPRSQTVVKVAAAVLAVAVAFVPRRRDVIVVAALGAAVVIALQIGLTHWFYLYLVWFLPLTLVAPGSIRRARPPSATAVTSPATSSGGPRSRTAAASALAPSSQPGAGAARRTCSMVSARRRVTPRITTPMSHGSSCAAS